MVVNNQNQNHEDFESNPEEDDDEDNSDDESLDGLNIDKGNQ